VDAREFLGLTRVDEHRWELPVVERLATMGRFLFGGCGLAAGLAALEEASGRPTVWGCAQYLAYAPLDSIVTIDADLVVVGGHVTQARATARTQGREVLTVNASLGTGELSAPEAWMTMPAVPGPEECPPRRLPAEAGSTIFEHVDCRVALGRTYDEIDGTPAPAVTALWARLPGHLEPSAATLAIFGDFVAGAPTQALGRRTMGGSLDNTLRVASLVPSEWVLCEIRLHALAGGFAQGTAFLWSETGTLLGTASQSIAAKYWPEAGIRTTGLV